MGSQRIQSVTSLPRLLGHCRLGHMTSLFVGASLIAQLVKNLPAMQETPGCFLGQEDLLEKGKATPSSILGLLLWLSW